MQPSYILETLPVTGWAGPFEAALQARAVGALEAGKIIFLPQLPFAIRPDELPLLSPAASGASRKNISFDPRTGQLANAAVAEPESGKLKQIMMRFAAQSRQLVESLFPIYAPHLEQARTSFRPDEIEGREYSPRHDDKRLHVDAFPSRPLQGRRILRLFSNVAPDGAPRHWRAGEKFPDFAERFARRVKAPLPGSAWLLERFGVTKSRRSAYDHTMLALHDGVKLDAAYQASAPRADLHFPAGATWMCFTDQVLHAALAGHCAFEQTFHLPVEAQAQPETAPLRVLEKMMQRKLA